MGRKCLRLDSRQSPWLISLAFVSHASPYLLLKSPLINSFSSTDQNALLIKWSTRPHNWLTRKTTVITFDQLKKLNPTYVEKNMAQYGEHYGKQTDEYGNPIHGSGATGGHGTGMHGATGQHGMTGMHGATGAEHGMTGMHGATGTEHGMTGMHGAAGTTGAYGTHGGGGIATGGTDAGLATGGGHHRRSGSSSSSSSEDDGQGGRRKKGLKDKIKEKLPGGGHGAEQPQATGMHGGAGYEHGGEAHEKKGMMEKIKEKLPGGGH